MGDIRLYIHQPEVVFRARVNQSVFAYPLDEIIYDTVTIGTFAGVGEGQTLRLGSAAGLDDLGRQRVKGASGTEIRIGRSSNGTNDGELDVVNNAWIDVLQEYRVWAKIPFIDEDGDIFKDGTLGPLGNVEEPPPIASGGAGVAGTIDSVTGVMTVEFDASNSVQFDAAVSSALSFPASLYWDLGDGILTAGLISDNEITAEFPPGFRYVTLTVVAGSLAFHTQYIPVFARDPADDDSTANFQITSDTYRADGHQLSLKILDDIPRSTFPDGTLVMIWEDQNPSVEVTSRTGTIFIGWIQTEDGNVGANATGTLKDTTLHCVDVLGRLKTLPGFPQRMEALEIADKWYETIYPNIFYYLWYLLYWHSNALDVSGLTLNTQTLNNFAFKSLGSDADNLYSQVNSLANNVTPDHYLAVSYDGQMMLSVDPILQYTVDRSAVIYVTLDETVITAVSFTYNRHPRVHQLRSYAVSGGDFEIIPLASLTPGESPGQGEQYIETSERITFSQFDLNNTEGNRYARLNARLGLFSITYPWTNLNTSLKEAVGAMGWVNLDLPAGFQPQRPLPFTVARGILHEISIAYDYQRGGPVRTATLNWELETSGPPAITLEVEAEEVV